MPTVTGSSASSAVTPAPGVATPAGSGASMLCTMRTPTGRAASISATACSIAATRSSSLGISGKATVSLTTPGSRQVVLVDAHVLLAQARQRGRARDSSAPVVARPAPSSARRARGAQRVVALVARRKARRLRVRDASRCRGSAGGSTRIAPGRHDARRRRLRAPAPAPRRSGRRAAACGPRWSRTARAAARRSTARVPAWIVDVGRRRASSAQNTTLPAGERPPPPLDADQRDELVEVAALGGVDEAGLVDRLELARQHRVLAREALGEQARHAARVAVGQQRTAPATPRGVVVREERACRRRARPRPAARAVGLARARRSCRRRSSAKSVRARKRK